ncbi:MAG TPA: hypothetical protein VKP67_15315 [Xanthobacteraceae bacterium]|nr:hypothetical protein [Xanthobacteraceae bacterium]
MNLGFETIGNATIIVHDGKPVLATDPWIEGEAYFGSWTFSHEIPEEQKESMRRAEYVWFSHGHPDHLNPTSLPLFLGQKVLLADHFGGRIFRHLQQSGFDVHLLNDRAWVSLSPKVRVYCISDYNQDAILLIDVDGRLLIDLNDASDCGWMPTVRQIASTYKTSFLMALTGYGDADMINFYDEDGRFIPPVAARRFPVGRMITQKMDAIGATYFVPSSSMHHYLREDSQWANAYVTKLDDYARGFKSRTGKLRPAFIRFDFETSTWSQIDPSPTSRRVLTAAECGDVWSDTLDPGEFARLEKYFKSFEHLGDFLDHVTLRVGGIDNTVSLNKKRFKRGITFEVPRHSLMTAVDHQIFDDLLIGNFMKTTLHGSWPKSRLYPDFTPYVTKYGDNGLARTREELKAYFAEYRKRLGVIHYLRHRLEQKSKEVFRARVPAESALFQKGKAAYWGLRRSLR